jgi:streptogrisin C
MSTADYALSNPLRSRGRGLLAATFVIALLRVAPVDAAEQPDSLAVDEYARRFDVNPTEADNRLESQAKAAGIANALSNRLGGDFAGVWFDNAEGQFVVPLVSNTDTAAVAKQFAEYGLDEAQYRTVLVDSTVADLEDAQLRLSESIKDPLAGGSARSGIDTSINAVVVEIASDISAEEKADLRARAAAVPVRVKIVEGAPKEFDDEPEACTWNNEPRRACDPPFHGGVEIWNEKTGAACTSAFAATGNANGNSFVITAGHCIQNNPSGSWWAQTANGYENPLGSWESYFYGSGNSDGGLIRVLNSNWWVKEWGWRGHVVIWGPPSNPAAIQNPSNPIYGSQSSYVGEYVCHSGRTTGSSCGTVQQLNVKVTYEGGNNLNHMTKVTGACGDGGDSGGPVYAGNYAVGIWSGGAAGTCNDHYYTEVRELESIYAVHVTAW